MNALDRTLHKTYLDWMLANADSYTHAVTLTLKPYRIVLTERGQFREALDEMKAQTNFRHFLNRLNANVFGNAAKRHGKSVSVLPILEGQISQKLLHYHCAMGNFRDDLPDAAIASIIQHAWQQTPFGNEQVLVEPMHSTRWVSYIAKELGSSNSVAFDLDNTRLPAASLT